MKTKTKRNGRSRNRNGQLKFGDTGPPNSTIVYRGPSRLPSNISPEIKTVELHAVVVAAYNNAGPSVIDGFASSSGVRLGGADFANWAALYREYRVLSVRVEFTPSFANSFVSVSTASALPWSTVIDRDDVSATGSYGNVLSNTSLSFKPLNERWTREAKMESTLEADFVEVTVDPTAFFVIKYFTTLQGLGSMSLATLGNLFVRWVVQFRTRD